MTLTPQENRGTQAGESAELRLQGAGLAPGVGVGKAVCVEFRGQDVFRVPLEESQLQGEVQRFREAVSKARSEVRAVRREAAAELGTQLDAIFEAQELILVDPALVRKVEDAIKGSGVNAEWALVRVADELEKRFEALEVDYLRERSDHLLDVTRVLLQELQGYRRHDLSEIKGDFVIIAHDLTPSEALRIGRLGPAAIAVETVGRTSHTTIIARSLHVPLIGGLENLLETVTTDDLVVADADRGELTLRPSEGTLGRAEQARLDRLLQMDQLARESRRETLTCDGVRVELAANIDLPEEISEVEKFGVCGVGLYRSEFLYIDRSPELPTEQEQLTIYRMLLDAVAGEQVVIRTYDLGGRKLAEEMRSSHEANPVLGLRGIRFTTSRPDLFKPQLRALLRAALGRNLAILLPMVATVEEVRLFKRQLEATAHQLAVEGVEHSTSIPVGAMIEVPAAALIAKHLAAEVDFLSIGSNDLVQYTLAVDRSNSAVEELYQPLHPSVLRLLKMVVEAADVAQIPVSLCGEMAADVRMSPVLVGLGLRRLSMSPLRVPEVRKNLARIDTTEAREVIESCLGLSTSAEVRTLLERHFGKD